MVGSGPSSTDGATGDAGLAGLVFEGEVEVVVVGLDADHLVVAGVRGDAVQEDPHAVSLHDLIAVVGRCLRLLDLQLHLAVGLDTDDANRAELPEGVERAFVDLQHRASLGEASLQSRDSGPAKESALSEPIGVSCRSKTSTAFSVNAPLQKWWRF